MEYKITLQLLLKISLDEIKIQENTKLKNINAITYSQGISDKKFSDTINNMLITNLYGFLLKFEKFIGSILAEDMPLNESDFAKLTVSFLWYNRLLKISQQKLYVNKNLDPNVINNLTLHFKWLEKKFFLVHLAMSSSRQ